ncbi:MAG: hydroxymethylbilane synthase [Bacillota bacterium]|nr:hydroxymethylbilane synthase [Bacillota bacterium]
MKYIIGTRGSKLAMVQTNYVRQRLEEAYPEDSFEIKVISTKGDRIQDRPLEAIGDKGLFVREIEEQILSGEVHIGVHSMKDMPAQPEKGLVFTKSWVREDPRDVLILREKKNIMELAPGAIIGTGSKRRKFQLLNMRPDLQVVDIRGNVDTRIRKMHEQKLDGIVLAAAGLKRLGMEEVISQYLEKEEMISAPAQGVLALEVREDNKDLIAKLDALYDEDTYECAKVERQFLDQIGGDCHVPVGAICTKNKEGFELHAMFGNEEGTNIAYAHVQGENPEEVAKEAVQTISEQMIGTVYLVGGGPGDPGLITVKGMELIRKADCIVYDRLSSPELLDDAKPNCHFIYVGKADRHHTMKQEDINLLLVKMAKRYKTVVRLKGGDVFVFGRGGEEGKVLKENGVPFVVVPGISSALAGLAYAGIPITHRGIATGFHVVTAHNRRDELADIDFEAMARSQDTNVFLMGLSKLHDITVNLLNVGMPKDTKAAVIASATTPQQKTCVGTLETIEEMVKEAGLKSPALIVVGDVINMRETLNFFETQPLFGKTYLVPKIGEKSSRLSWLVKENGATFKEVTVGKMAMVPMVFTKEELSKVDWMIFTSRNGVDSFFENLFASNLDVRALGNTKIATIGTATNQALNKYGLSADLIPTEFNSTALVKTMKDILNKEDVVWYLKVNNAEDKMKKGLEEVCDFHAVPVYENVTVPLEENIDVLAYDHILFTCGSSARRVLSCCSKEIIEQLNEKCACVSIGPECTKVLNQLGIHNLIQSKASTYESMVRSLMD